MSSAVSIEDLTFTYADKEKPALKQIRSRIEKGSLVAILGHGGAGKSSLCYALNALIPRFFRGSYQGRVVIFGQEVGQQTVAQMSNQVGLVLQDFEAQLFSTNVELEMAFGPENHCLPRLEIEQRLHHYLEVIGLESLRQRQPATLSGGQKQRLAIGSILAMEPEILVLDEPTTDLDPKGASDVLDLAQNLRRKGRTLLMVTPEPELALEADQVWLMHEGEIIAQGPPTEIFTNLSLLERSGVKLPSFLALFQALGWPGRPLTLEQALSLINVHQLITKKNQDVQPRLSEPTPGPLFIQGLGLVYGYPLTEDKVLKGIDLTIREGEFIALLGQNGSGKTTLAKHFNGLLKPEAGSLLIEGKPIGAYSHKDLARKVGYVFQNPDHQIFGRTVEEEVGFGLKVLGVDVKTIQKRVQEVLEIVGLQGYDKKVPFTLTKGERQRVAVASVLAAQPKVIILDEPTTGLDYEHQVSIMELLTALNQKGHTILIITHSMWVATEYARRTIILKEGSILLDGPTRSVFANESKLAEASLAPPPIVQLSNLLGTQALTLKQMIEELTSNAQERR
ncbi:MAG: cobalt ABC transporter ATP-binding protein [Desulfobacca sp.]|nr:cobalt ABC transporter ATP-binding protein [Desulfobacca sp.]